MSKNVAVAIVGDFKFLKKYFNNFYFNLTERGQFTGDLIVITSFLTPTFLINGIIKNSNVKVLRFKKIRFNKLINQKLYALNTKGKPNRHITKNFQWHKLNLFSERLKRWKYILYLDINMTVHFPLKPILDMQPKGYLFARSDGYPTFDKFLSSQFDNSKEEFSKLTKEFNLKTSKYFQSGLLFYDTNLITSNFIKNCINLVEEFPITLTNEQAILNLYFLRYNLKFEELPMYVNGYKTYFYWYEKNIKTIITKQLVEKYK